VAQRTDLGHVYVLVIQMRVLRRSILAFLYLGIKSQGSELLTWSFGVVWLQLRQAGKAEEILRSSVTQDLDNVYLHHCVTNLQPAEAR
jgi:hypothetical protein